MAHGIKKKIFVFGAAGMLGNYLTRYFGDQPDYEHVVAIGRDQFEVGRSALVNLSGLFSDLGIDHSSVVINAVGLIPQAVLGDTIDVNDYFLVNGLFPHYLAFSCSVFRAQMFQLSTDCVFSGIKDPTLSAPYLEGAITDEKKPYGLSKAMGEPISDWCSVVRCSVIGEEIHHDRSLLQWVLSTGRKQSSIDGYENHYWNGLTCLHLAIVLDQIIKEGRYWTGVRHFGSPSRLSKFELVSLICEEYDLACKVNRIQKHVTIDKCLESSYDLNMLMSIPPIRTQLKALKNFKLRR